MNQTVIRWILSYDHLGKLVITEHKAPQMFPINRMVGKSGYHHVELVNVSGTEFICTYDITELSHVQVSKINPNKNQPGFIDLTEDDKDKMSEIAKHFLKNPVIIIQ